MFSTLLPEIVSQSSLADNDSFLPKVNDLNKNHELCERLSQHLYIDPFFWSENAYESNGFFLYEDQPVNAQDFTGDSRCNLGPIQAHYVPDHS